MKTEYAKLVVVLLLLIAVNYANAASTLTCTATDEGKECGTNGQVCKSEQCICVTSGHPRAATFNYPDKCDATGKIAQKIETCDIMCCYVTKEDCGAAGKTCQNGACSGTGTASPASGSGAAASGSSGASSSGFVKESCSCTCNNKQLNATGMFKPGFIEKVVTDESATAKAKCQDQCARTCGGFTNCSYQTDAECTDCCTTFCTTYYTKGGAGSSEKDGEKVTDLCKVSCKSTCKYKGTVNGITEVIYMIAGLLGAFMIAIHGIRMVTSQDPHDRDAAKSSIIHVIIALIIIAMAAALVNMFITMGTTPGTS